MPEEFVTVVKGTVSENRVVFSPLFIWRTNYAFFYGLDRLDIPVMSFEIQCPR